MFSLLGGTFKPNLLILGLCLGTLGVYFVVFLQLWGWTLDSFSDFSGNGSSKVQKRIKRTVGWVHVHRNIPFFRQWGIAFRLRRRERIEDRTLLRHRGELQKNDLSTNTATTPVLFHKVARAMIPFCVKTPPSDHITGPVSPNPSV